MKNILALIIWCCCSFIVIGQNLSIKKVTPEIQSSFRGLSVVDDQVAWVSGNKGWIGKTANAGKTWKWMRIWNDSTSDYRTLYAFDSMRAIVAGTGSPAKIFMTKDGGNKWNQVYSNDHPEIFLDGIDFWNVREGIIYGDPIDGHLTLLKTIDGGDSWQLVDTKTTPELYPGEASFAASGTTIRCYDRNKVLIGTGGMHARLFFSGDKGKTWSAKNPPIIQGKSTQGIFSIAINLQRRIVLVGGDFQNPELSSGHNLFSDDGGNSWNIPKQTTKGYRSCVEFLSDVQLIAVGPTGSEYSTDGGHNWISLINAPDGNTVRKARKGNLILIGGKNGVWKITSN